MVEPTYAQKIADELDRANFFKNSKSKSDFVSDLLDGKKFDNLGLFIQENNFMGVDFYFDSNSGTGYLLHQASHTVSEAQVNAVNANLNKLGANYS